MSKTKSFETGWITLTSNVAASSDNGFTPGGPFILAGPVSKARITWEMRNRIGTIEIIGAINFTNNPFAPDATYTIIGGSTWQSTNGLYTPNLYTDVTAGTVTSQLCRFGWATRNTSGSGTSPSSCEVRGRVDYQWNDNLQRIHVPPTLVYADSTTARFFPVTDWMNGILFTDARGMFESRNLNGNMVVGWGFQTADDPESPGTATALGATRSSDGITYPTVFTDVTSNGKQLMRFGWRAALSSGTTTAYAYAGGELDAGRNA